MDMDFGLLLILLLPGFLGLWIYKQTTVEDIDRRGEWTQVAIGLCFGVTNLFVYFIFMKLILLKWPQWGLNELIPKQNAIAGLLVINFWVCYRVLVAVALCVGVIAGILQGWGLLPTHFLPKLVGRILKKSVRTKHESGLRYLIEKKGHRPETPIKAYPIGNPQHVINGRYGGISESESEVVVSGENGQ